VLLQSAEDWDAKAARAREIVKRLTDPNAIDAMLGIAWYYDLLANYARADAEVPSLGNNYPGLSA
jgi:hypothetical protein